MSLIWDYKKKFKITGQSGYTVWSFTSFHKLGDDSTSPTTNLTFIIPQKSLLHYLLETVKLNLYPGIYIEAKFV